MNWKETLNALGMREDLRLDQVNTLTVALGRWKELTVEATRAGDQQGLRKLSQAHEVLKRVRRSFCVCGRKKQPGRCLCGRLSGMVEKIKSAIEVGTIKGERVLRTVSEWRLPEYE